MTDPLSLRGGAAGIVRSLIGLGAPITAETFWLRQLTIFAPALVVPDAAKSNPLEHPRCRATDL
jgi:hypothetical protein